MKNKLVLRNYTYYESVINCPVLCFYRSRRKLRQTPSFYRTISNWLRIRSTHVPQGRLGNLNLNCLLVLIPAPAETRRGTSRVQWGEVIGDTSMLSREIWLVFWFIGFICATARSGVEVKETHPCCTSSRGVGIQAHVDVEACRIFGRIYFTAGYQDTINYVCCWPALMRSDKWSKNIITSTWVGTPSVRHRK